MTSMRLQLTKVVAINKSTNTAIVARGGTFVFIDTEKKDVVGTAPAFNISVGEGWENFTGEVPTLWAELTDAAITSMSIDSSEFADEDRVFRVPRNVQKISQHFSDTTTTLKSVHEFAAERKPEPELVRQWVRKITDQFPVPGALIASAFEPSDTSVYFGRAVGEDTTECDAMYALNSEGVWAERVDGQWVPVTEEDPGLLYNLIMLDPESATALASWADEPDELDGGSLELAALTPDETGLFYAAEAELDMEMLDRLFDVYDSTERSINASKQVRGQGGKFGPSVGGSEGTAEAPKARLSVKLPLIPDIGARIDAYLAEVGRGGTEPVAEEDPTAKDDFSAEGLSTALTAALNPLHSKGSIAISEELFADAIETGIAYKVGVREEDGVVLYDLNPNVVVAEDDFALTEFNWVEDVGGLPPYIKRIAKHLKAKGMAEGRAIATAVNVVKKMCATGDLNWPGKQDANPGSQAEACAAVASWEAKKAKAKATAIVNGIEFISPDEMAEFAVDAELAVTAEQAGVPTTDVKPLYIAIVDDLDTDAVLDVVSLVPPAAGKAGDVTAWKRAAGQWVAANELLQQLRGSTPPSCVELTDPAVLKEVLAQVDKSTKDDADPEQVPGSTEIAPDGTAPANQPKPAETPGAPVKTSNFGAMRDGSYPIRNKADLKKAIQAFGRAKNKSAAKKHIISEAKKLGATSLLPDHWEFSTEVDLASMAARGYAFSDGSLLIRNSTELRKAVKEASGLDQQLHVIKRARALNRVDMIPRHWNPAEASVEHHTLWGPYGEILPVTAAGGADRNRGGAEKLRFYWTHGLGGKKIGWGQGQKDWTRCVAYLTKYLGVRARGYCALRHFEMNGYYPGDRRNK